MKIGVPSGNLKEKAIVDCDTAFKTGLPVCISHHFRKRIIPGCATETKSGLELSFYPCRSQISKQTFSSHPILQKQFREPLMLDQQTDEFHVSR